MAGRRALEKPLTQWDRAGEQTLFYLDSIISIPHAMRRHGGEVLRLLGEIVFGTGALAVIGGTVVTVAFLTAFAGIELGLQGYSQLGNLGIEALTGFVSAYINTRLAAPVIAGIALVATVGAGFTAQLGAMRVSEEIDAIEVMAVDSRAYLISTRIVAGVVAIVPLYTCALLAGYACTRLVVVVLLGQSGGAYDHYFATFLIPSDIGVSYLNVIIMAIVAMMIHCYYGFTASGGPAGVGRAVGHAVRLSLIAVLFTDMLLSFALYGTSNTLHISG